ncbi:MAG: hypothetical protein ACR2OZ_03020 [Verrucomicrobiales bacterium]
MSRAKLSRRNVLGGIAGAAATSLLPNLGNGADGTSRDAPAMRAACERNLKLIFDAVDRFVKKRGDYPEHLGKLVSEGFIDPSVLICPLLQSSGHLQIPKPELINNISKDSLTLYVWEYSEAQSPFPNTTMRDFKERQRKTGVGDWVPMVRCHAHSENLNLSFGGAVYSSSVYWERLFRHLCPFPYLGSSLLFARRPPHTAHLPRRAPDTDARLLDLTAAYNALIEDDWMSVEPGDGATDFIKQLGPAWIWKHDGVPFDVRGAVQLGGKNVTLNLGEPPNRPEYYPPSIPSIPVDQEASTAHLLAGVIYEAPANSEVAKLRSIFSDGSVEELSLVFGQHVWHQAPNSSHSPSPESTLAWRRASPASNDAPHAIYHVRWNLKRPGRLLKQLEFSSSESSSCPFLLAVTLA